MQRDVTLPPFLSGAPELNVLKPHLRVTIQTLLRNGTSQRKIERLTGVDRKTIRRHGELIGREANSPGVATGSDPGQTAILEVEIPPPRPPARAPKAARSACEDHRPWIETQVQLGRNAISIYQDLVERHGFTHRYNSVKRCTELGDGRILGLRPERRQVQRRINGDAPERQRHRRGERHVVGVVPDPQHVQCGQHRVAIGAGPRQRDERAQQRAHGTHALDQSIADPICATARLARALLRERLSTHAQEPELQGEAQLECRCAPLLDRAPLRTREREVRLELEGRERSRQTPTTQKCRSPLLHVAPSRRGHDSPPAERDQQPADRTTKNRRRPLEKPRNPTGKNDSKNAGLTRAIGTSRRPCRQIA